MTIEKILADVQTPAYIADETALRANLAKIAAVKHEAGLGVIYAIKACPFYQVFGIIDEYVDGSTASGPYEAKLGHDHFGRDKQVHVFSPAYTMGDIDALLILNVKVHFYFNSYAQLLKFTDKIKMVNPKHEVGLRINPRISVTEYEAYNPCRQGSHLGIPIELLGDVDFSKVDFLHAHALCENLGKDSALLIDTVAQRAAEYIPQVKYVNFGGGHYISHPDYEPQLMIDAVERFKARFPDVGVMIEPGGAIVRDGGYLVASVIDIMENDGVKTAVLDASPNCHVPDVIKAGVYLPVRGAGETGERAHDYVLAARTCMARDLWGGYSFDVPLKAGDKIVFENALQYSMGEANWFNGHQRPSLGILRADGTYDVMRRYHYADFEYNCG